jgi:predicted ATPase with chaperone activity
LLLISTFTFAQKGEKKDIVLVIKNKETDEVISKVTVSVVKYNQNYFSNEEGIVKFELVKPSKISLSHPDFKDVVLQSTTIKKQPLPAG